MTIGYLARKVQQRLRQNGVYRTLWWVITKPFRQMQYWSWRRTYQRQEEEFDQTCGVETSGITKLASLDIPSRNLKYGSRYQATPAHVARNLIAGLPIDHRDFIFVDLGSGKGRVLLVASEFPFKKIIGVEFAPELNAQAQQNIRAYQSASRKCQELEAICADATTYPLPPEPTVFFFYNPFQEPVMREVVTKIGKSLLEHPRRVFIIYYIPTARYVLDRMTSLVRIETGKWHCIYTNRDESLKPSSEGAQCA